MQKGWLWSLLSTRILLVVFLNLHKFLGFLNLHESFYAHLLQAVLADARTLYHMIDCRRKNERRASLNYPLAFPWFSFGFPWFSFGFAFPVPGPISVAVFHHYRYRYRCLIDIGIGFSSTFHRYRCRYRYLIGIGIASLSVSLSHRYSMSISSVSLSHRQLFLSHPLNFSLICFEI